MPSACSPLTETDYYGWLVHVVQEYETNDLASDSEDEKKIRKARAAAEKKRKETKSNIGNTSKNFSSCSDLQLFLR